MLPRAGGFTLPYPPGHVLPTPRAPPVPPLAATSGREVTAIAPSCQPHRAQHCENRVNILQVSTVFSEKSTANTRIRCKSLCYNTLIFLRSSSADDREEGRGGGEAVCPGERQPDTALVLERMNKLLEPFGVTDAASAWGSTVGAGLWRDFS